MYLRVTAFKSDPAQLEKGIAFFRDKIVPAMEHAPGFLGATAVVDREKSTGAASTLWESLEAMNKAEQLGQQSRIESAESTGLEVVDVERFEITSLEMVGTSVEVPSYTRITTAYGNPDNLDEATEMVRDKIVPKLKSQPGFKAFAAGVNRMTGRGFTASSWATAEQREASNAVLTDDRKRIEDSGRLYAQQIDLVETVVAVVKLPTTA
jgi:heme-degrading monooxygenase HmoA